MGLLQKAVETYDCHAQYIGDYREGAVLAPIVHTVVQANIEVTLDEDGKFITASIRDKKAPKILIPVTEASAGRTGKKTLPHPLCDKLKYFIPESEACHEYCNQLEKWKNSQFSHPKLMPILVYIKKGTLIQDLLNLKIIKLNDKHEIDQKFQDCMICWRVQLTAEAEECEACWQDKELFQSFISYHKFRSSEKEEKLCMVTGEKAPCASQHPKGIVSFHGDAKLVSANDKSGFTYRGRFLNDSQAITIGYEASQKAHNALRWLIARDGAQSTFGGRTFICWNPQGKKVPKITNPFKRSSETKSYTVKASEYKKELQRTLAGFQSELPDEADVIIAAFDAATTGRLALTYYNELRGSDFLQRLYQWDLHCCWPNGEFGIQSPSLYQMIHCIYGTEQKEKGSERYKFKADDKILRQQMQRLVACRIECAPMPLDVMRSVFHRANSLISYEENNRKQLLFTACAVIRKYRYDRLKEEWNMALEPDRMDRSYQFGRLLALFEKIEQKAYWNAHQENEDRETNAMRLQSVFCQRPMHTASNIEKQLEQAYFPGLKPKEKIFYKNLISEVMENISTFPQNEWNQPLSETYLMGYYLQRAALYQKKNNETEEKENDSIGE